MKDQQKKPASSTRSIFKVTIYQLGQGLIICFNMQRVISA